MKVICDIAVQIPWVMNQERSSQKLLTHDGVMSKVFLSVGIVVYLGLVCCFVRRFYQVCLIAGG